MPRFRFRPGPTLAALPLLLSGCGLTGGSTCSGQPLPEFSDAELVEIVSRFRSPQHGYAPGFGDPIGRLASDCCRITRYRSGIAETLLVAPADRTRYRVTLRWPDLERGRPVILEYYAQVNACGVITSTSGDSYSVNDGKRSN